MEQIKNRTFDEIQPGDTASLVRTLTYKDIEVFAIMSGDINPTHIDDAFAKSDMFHEIVAHGMWGGALISTVLVCDGEVGGIGHRMHFVATDNAGTSLADEYLKEGAHTRMCSPRS